MPFGMTPTIVFLTGKCRTGGQDRGRMGGLDPSRRIRNDWMAQTDSECGDMALFLGSRLGEIVHSAQDVLCAVCGA